MKTRLLQTLIIRLFARVIERSILPSLLYAALSTGTAGAEMISTTTVCSASFSNTIASTTSVITNGLAEFNVPGMSVALVQGTSIVWAAGFGYAVPENGTPAAPDTVYMLGSISKTLTTSVLLHDRDQGKVDLDASITNYISEFSMLERFTDDIPNITVRRLLNHHSGIPGDIYNGLFVTGAYRAGWEDWLIDYLQDDYPAAQPGLGAVYCNSGFVLAGEIIARVSSTNINDRMDSVLFQPLGMTNTSFTIITNKLASNHSGDETTPTFESLASATGGAFTTVEDIAQFIMMMLGAGTHPNGAVIMQSNTVYQAMAVPEISTMDFSSFFVPGLGLDSVDDPAMKYAGRTWMKDGSTSCHDTLMEILPDHDIGVIVMGNSGNFGLLKYRVVRECLKYAVTEAGGPSPSLPTMPRPPSLTNIQDIAGTYATASGYDEIADNRNGTLTWTRNPAIAPESHILTLTNDSYSISGYDATICFTNVTCEGSNYLAMVRYGSMSNSAEHYMYYDHVISLVGTKFSPPPVTEAWSNRLSTTYLIDNYIYDDAGAYSYPLFSFSETNGFLFFLDQGTPRLLNPTMTNIAFMAVALDRSDSCVRCSTTNGIKQVWFGGNRGTDITTVPELTVNTSTSGAATFHDCNWFKFTAASNVDYTLATTITDETNTMHMVLLDNTMVTPLTNSENNLHWHSVGTGVMYVALSPVSDTDYTLRLTANNRFNDFNADGRSDMAVYDTSDGRWYILSSTGSVLAWELQWGMTTGTPVPGDYNGDGEADLAVFDSVTGLWYIRTLSGNELAWALQWGWAGATPVPGDFNGDAIDDLAVFDTNTGYWYIRSIDNTLIAWAIQWGWPGAAPVAADYNGDAIDDLAVFDRNSGLWYVYSIDGTLISWATQWGWPGAIPVPGDYDGDGVDDLAVFDATTGDWYAATTDGSTIIWSTRWGWANAVPVPGDFDGDNVADLAVYDRSTGSWYIRTVSGETIAWATRWGTPTSMPAGYAW